MAENPMFNNSNMFTNVNDATHKDIEAKNASEVLATQGNVINSIKTFWNKLRAKLAYAISRPEYSKQVGGNYVPIFVNADGVVQECQPTTIQANIAQNGIITIPVNTIPNDNIYTGTTVCISVLNNSASGSTNDLQIQHKDSESLVKYPSGVTVQAKDISKGDLLLTTFCKNSINSSNNFWILLNKINTVVSTAVEGGGHPGLMTADDKAKLDTIDEGANNYSLPVATDKTLGGIQLGYITNETNRNYKLQTDNNGNGYVNVPWTDTNTHWTANLKVGNSTSTGNESTTGNTYIKIVENGTVSSSVKVVGNGGTTVSSNNGELTISSSKVPSYSILKTDNTNSNNLSTTGYRVFGPGRNNANTNHYLAGDGTWVNGLLVPIPTDSDEGKYLKAGTNGSLSWVAINTTASSK